MPTFVALESADDPRISDYQAIPEPELVRLLGLFVAEGRFVVQRVIEDSRYRVRSLLLSEAARSALEPQLAVLPPDTPAYVCGIEAFPAITGFAFHRGCLALVERPPAPALEEVIEGARTVVVLEDVANADNVGGVFRNAAALGADAVLLSPGCCDPLYRKAIRTSMAATLRVPFGRVEEWPGGLRELRCRGFTIAALTPREPAETLEAFASRSGNRVALVAGTEGAGLSASVESSADVRVRIPICSAVDSLNVSVAVAIALHAISWRMRPGG